MSNITPVASAQTALIPTYTASIGGVPMVVCDARTLHAYLGNGELFATWFKARCGQYGFTENQDFAIALEISKAKRGGHNRKDYHLTLGMAKELSMVENNDQGKTARRYFIDMERRALEALGQVVTHNHIESLTPSEQQTLSEIVHGKVNALPDEAKSKALAEIWSRLHHKFRVAKYSQLARTQLADAILYVTGMELRSVRTPEAHAPEYLSNNDMQNVKRIIWLISSRMNYGEAWTQGAWHALRKRCDVPAPGKFEVRHLPLIADELAFIAKAALVIKTEVMQTESAMLKRVLRHGMSDLDALVSDMNQGFRDLLARDFEQDTIPRWFNSDVRALIERSPAGHGVSYNVDERLAA